MDDGIQEEIVRNSPQISITLSQRAYDEFLAVARWKHMSVAKMIRQIVEREHESPSFASLYRRAKDATNEAVGDYEEEEE